MIIYLLLLFLMFLLPMVWMSYIFKKNDNILDNMPFTGIEFGNMILKEKGLQNVQIEETSIGDHYDLTEKKS